MKTRLIALGLLLFLALPALAGVTSSNLLTYTSVNATTNNGAAVLIGTAYIQTAPSYVIQTGGLTDTNAMVVYVQYGLDTNTFSTVATYRQTTTNAQDGVIAPGRVTLNIYARTSIATTNNVSVGSKAIFTTP